MEIWSDDRPELNRRSKTEFALTIVAFVLMGMVAFWFQWQENGTLPLSVSSIIVVLIVAGFRAVYLLKSKRIGGKNDQYKTWFVVVGLLATFWFVWNLNYWSTDQIVALAVLFTCSVVALTIRCARAPSLSRTVVSVWTIALASALFHCNHWTHCMALLCCIVSVVTTWRLMLNYHADLLQTHLLFRQAADARAELKREIAKNALLARTDDLTGIGNRRAFMEGMDRLFNEARESSADIMVSILDLNKFKTINDTYGHEAGDCVIRFAARALSEVAHDDWVFARLGGDEFVLGIILNPDDNPAAIANRLFEQLPNWFYFDEMALHFSWSMGYGISNAQDGKIASLLKTADISLYRSKQLGGPIGEEVGQSQRSAS